MKSEISIFFYKLRKFSQELYLCDVKEVNKELRKINSLYDRIMQNKNVSNNFKKNILSNYIRFSEVDMRVTFFIVKRRFDLIRKRYRNYRIKNSIT